MTHITTEGAPPLFPPKPFDSFSSLPSDGEVRPTPPAFLAG